MGQSTKRELPVEESEKKRTVGLCFYKCKNWLKSKCGSAKDDSGRLPNVSTTECLRGCDESGGPLVSTEKSPASVPQPMMHTQMSSVSVNTIEPVQRPGTAFMVAEAQSDFIKEGHFLSDAAVIVSEAGRNILPVPDTQPQKTEPRAGAVKVGSITETQSTPMRDGHSFDPEQVDLCSKESGAGAKPTPGTLLSGAIGETSRTIDPRSHQLPAGKRSPLSELTATRSPSVGSTSWIRNDFPTSSGQRQTLWRKRCSLSAFKMAGWRWSPIKSLPNHPSGESPPEGLSNTKLELKNFGDGTRDHRSLSVSSSQAPSPASPQATRAIQCLRPNDKTTQIAYRRAIALRALEQQQMREDEWMATRLRGGGCCGGGQVVVDTSPHNRDPGVPTPTRESQHPPRPIGEKSGQPMAPMKSAGSISGGGARSRAQSHVSGGANPERPRRQSQATMRDGASVSRQPSQRGTRSRTTSQVEPRSRKQSRVGEQPPMPSQAHGPRSRKQSTVPAVPSIP